VQLLSPFVSVTRTNRRRFLWAAWWSGAPNRDPFHKPDAYSGGARSVEDALAAAIRAAGCHLILGPSEWARAWVRILAGRPAWDEKRTAGSHESHTAAPKGSGDANLSIWEILGISQGASPQEIKRAYRERALEVHPDRGGSAEAFRNLQRAYDEALVRAARPSRRK
jgi:hypothetical protein